MRDAAARMRPAGLPGDPPDPAALPPGCAFAPRCPVALDRCHELDVGLRTVGPDHRAACVHVGDRSPTGADAAIGADGADTTPGTAGTTGAARGHGDGG